MAVHWAFHSGGKVDVPEVPGLPEFYLLLKKRRN